MPKFVMFTWVHPEYAAAWESWSDEAKQADVDRHRGWFGAHGASVRGGEELDYPRTVKALRPGRQGEGVIVTDGPYVETKEFLGGFVIIEAESLDEAVAMASEWPSLASQPHAVVEVQPTYARG
jgi:hypothetical protein